MSNDEKRLINEWLEYDKIILAVDYDDTIFPWKYSNQSDCDKILKLVKRCKEIGAYVMIHTCSPINRHEEIINYCKSKGLSIDSINSNPIELPYGKEGKPYYNWQLCDRSGLAYSYKILNNVSEIIFNIKNK